MMQPYQKATQEILNQAQGPRKFLTTAATVGASLAGGSAIAGRILPLLDKYVPGELMRKGLSKISPRIGKFVDGAINNGYSLDDVRDFMADKFSGAQEQENPKQENPFQDFQTNFPILAQGLASVMQQGKSPEEAAKIIRNSTALGSATKKFEKEMGKNFVDYVLELFGPQNADFQSQQPQQAQPQQLQQAQGGGIDQEIMAALDKILKM